VTTTSEVSTKTVMKDDIDIGQMISGSTADVSVQDLSRRGFKRVKVLNQEAIKGLILEAVKRVLESRREEISKEERERVIEESRREFEELVKKRVDEERERIRRTEEELRAREQEIKLISEELSGLREEVKAKAEAQVKAESEAAELRNEVARLKGELEAKTVLAAKAESEAESLRKEATERLAEVERVRGEKEALEKDLDYYKRAYEEHKSREEQGGKSDMGQLAVLFRELIHEMRSSAASTEQKTVGDLKESMELLADRIAKSVAAAGGKNPGTVSVGDPTEDVMAAFLKMEASKELESNLGKVETKKAQAKKGVSGSLEKLRSMQKSGGTQGGS